MQILIFGLEKAQSKITYFIISGIYSFVAKVYDIMISLSGAGTDAGSIDKFSAIGDVATVMYTIAGIFMLFRVTIAMINMLINPDAINDGKAGAGKLITRIVTSILLLLAFVPNGFVFGDEGVLNRIESALLAPGGLISNIIPDSISDAAGNNADTTTNNSDSSSNTNSNASASADTVSDGINAAKDIAEDAVQNTQNSVAMNGLIENVYAKSTKVADCYYLYKIKSNKAITTGTSKEDTAMLDNGRPGVDADRNYVHMTIYKGKNSSSNWTNKHRICLKKKGLKNLSDCNKYYLVFEDSKEKYFSPPTGLGFSTSGNYYSNFKPNKCPRLITASITGVQQLNQYYQAGKGTKWTNTKNYGWLGGWNSPDKLYGYINKAKAEVFGTDKNKVSNTKEKAPNTVEPDASRIAALYGNDEYLSESKSNPLSGLTNYQDAVAFAQMSMGTFMSCTGNTDCPTLKAGSLIGITDDQIVDGMSNNSVSLDFIPSVIAGVGILIWVLVLCVDVIVRRFKLLLLQMIAPIPIISYVDPNDKMFEQWRKMYTATYLDLFLKLIAIAFAIYLLQIVDVLWDESSNLIEKFFYIVAILVFAKMIPSMISKIFGLDNLGGSFKDITGMGKAALGVGAGAAIGSAAGVISSVGAGGNAGMALLGAARGALMGAGSGVKGKPLEGGRKIADINRATREANRNGSSFAGRLGARAQNFFGIDNEAELESRDIENARRLLEPEEERIANVDRQLADAERQIADAERQQLEPLKRRQQVHSSLQSNIKNYEDRVEGRMKNHLYDNLSEVQDYWKKEAELAYAEENGASAQRIEQLRSAVGLAAFNAKEASKDYEMSLQGTGNGDSIAQMYLENAQDLNNQLGYGTAVDWTDATNGLKQFNLQSQVDNNGISNQVTQIEQTYDVQRSNLNAQKRTNDADRQNLDAQKRALDSRERVNKRSASQANMDAVRGKK